MWIWKHLGKSFMGSLEVESCVLKLVWIWEQLSNAFIRSLGIGTCAIIQIKTTSSLVVLSCGYAHWSCGMNVSYVNVLLLMTMFNLSHQDLPNNQEVLVEWLLKKFRELSRVGNSLLLMWLDIPLLLHPECSYEVQTCSRHFLTVSTLPWEAHQ